MGRRQPSGCVGYKFNKILYIRAYLRASSVEASALSDSGADTEHCWKIEPPTEDTPHFTRIVSVCCRGEVAIFRLTDNAKAYL